MREKQVRISRSSKVILNQNMTSYIGTFNPDKPHLSQQKWPNKTMRHKLV